jgi:hypothetical protein
LGFYFKCKADLEIIRAKYARLTGRLLEKDVTGNQGAPDKIEAAQ